MILFLPLIFLVANFLHFSKIIFYIKVTFCHKNTLFKNKKSPFKKINKNRYNFAYNMKKLLKIFYFSYFENRQI